MPSKFNAIPTEIREYLAIDECSPTGLKWIKVDHCKNKVISLNDPAGSWDSTSRPSYYVVIFKGKKYKAHRVIWYLHTGSDPCNDLVDHIDRDRRNNKVTNLRLLTNSESANNRRNWGGVKYRGVSYAKDSRCFVSLIVHENKRTNLGLYSTAEDAALVWDYHAIRLGKTFKILNFPQATDAERVSALRRRVKQKGTFLDGRKLRGVSFDKTRNKYQAYVRTRNASGASVMRALGRYSTALEAALIRDAEVLRLGLADDLNFPNGMQ